MPEGSIVIVDDTPANLNVLASILSREGYKVRPANNGSVALTVVQHALPDLILLDIQMPGMNGYEVCRQLKEQEHSRDIPVIFISALDDASDKVEAFRVGGVDYISKPFQIEEVLARVENQLVLLRQRRMIASLGAHQAELVRRLGDTLRGPLERIRDRLALLRAGDPTHAADAIARIDADLELLGRTLNDLLPQPSADA